MAKCTPDYFVDRRNTAMHEPYYPIPYLYAEKQANQNRPAPNTSTKISFRRSQLLGLLVCLLATLTSASLLANPVATRLDDRSSDQVTRLISQLDSKDYDQREAAAQDLIEIGEPALRPLALKSFECSPEACWRIRKILEQISTLGSETVFYKTTGILQLRFDSSNSEMEKRLSALETKWKLQRKKNAISSLRKKGALINDPFEGQERLGNPQLENQIFLGGGQHIVVINGRVVELSSNQSNPAKGKPKRAPKKRLSDTDAKKEIERILGSNLKQARQIVIGDNDADQEPDAQPDDQNLLDAQRQMMARGRFLGAAGNGGATGPGVSIELGERWKGNASDLEALTDVAKLTEVKLTKQTLSSESLKFVGSIKTISKLILENCELDAKELQNVKWSKSLREIELAELELNNGFLAGIKAIPSVNLLTFRECQFASDSGFDSLGKLKSLRGLQFKGLDISTELFESFAQMKQLSFINLSYCKFKTSDYKALKELRPNLQVSFTAKAFLGVRGPMDLAQGARGIGGGCVVSEVIAGSGAEKGGVKVHDIIETVNG